MAIDEHRNVVVLLRVKAAKEDKGGCPKRCSLECPHLRKPYNLYVCQVWNKLLGEQPTIGHPEGRGPYRTDECCEGETQARYYHGKDVKPEWLSQDATS